MAIKECDRQHFALQLASNLQTDLFTQIVRRFASAAMPLLYHRSVGFVSPNFLEIGETGSLKPPPQYIREQ
jgi:hypothetical protein